MKRDDHGEWSFKGSASSVLEVYPIWREFVRNLKRLKDHADPGVRARARDAEPTVRSFELLCRSIDGIVLAKYGRAPANLRSRMQEHLGAYIAAYGEQATIPKHHWMFHLWKQIQEDGGVLWDCWVNERENKGVKAFARNIENTTAYSKSVATRCLMDAAKALETFEPTRHCTPVLVNESLRIHVAMSLARSGEHLEVASVEASLSMAVLNKYGFSVRVSGGVFLRCGGEAVVAGILVCCLRVLPSKRAFLQIRECVPVLELSPHATRWRETGCIRLVEALLLEEICLHAAGTDERLVLRAV